MVSVASHPESALVLALQGLMHSSGPVGRHRQLVLVLEGELYLVPFALLKGSASNEYLYERFTLIAVPAVRSLGPHSKVTTHCPDSGSPMQPEGQAGGLGNQTQGIIHTG